MAICSEKFKGATDKLIFPVKIKAILEHADEIDDIKEDLILEINKIFGSCSWLKEIKKFNRDTIDVLFNEIDKYAKDNGLETKYCELIRNINLKLKSKNVNLFFSNRVYYKFGYAHEEIVKDGFIPIDVKIQCDRCDLKCTDKNININDELTYIKTIFTNNKKEDYHINAWCSGGEKLRGVILKDKLHKRNTKQLNKWAVYIKNRNEKCVFCGSEENLHAHHIRPISVAKKYQYDIYNGITLCEKCHKRIHRMYRGIEPPCDVFYINNTEFRKDVNFIDNDEDMEM